MISDSQAALPPREAGKLRILAVSDIVEGPLHNQRIKEWLAPIDLIISCGDLPASYLDFLMTLLVAPCYHVIGNHCAAPHPPDNGRCSPDAYPGIVDLYNHPTAAKGLLLAGIEGSPLYSGGSHQYTEREIRLQLIRLIPRLLLNHRRSGRYLDILVSHAPPRGIHDDTDVTHRGFTSFLWFLKRFHPLYMLHGHTHRYIKTLPFITRYEQTAVLNCYGHRIIDIPADPAQRHTVTHDGPLSG